MAGGRSIQVTSPESIYLPSGARLVLVQDLESDSGHVVDLLLVSDLEFPHTQVI